MDDEIQVIVPAGMFGANEFDSALDKFLRELAVKFDTEPEAETRWAEKYGTHVDNDIFMMRPYCWCERESECAWCTGCGAYEDTCEVCKVGSTHTPTCYQTELNERRREAGLSHSVDGVWREAVIVRNYDTQQAVEDVIYSELCAAHGLDRERGAAIHCDCGADEASAELRKTKGCPYQLGTEIFAPFKPYIHGERGYYDPPNFWYRPLDFRVTWYKYIGRDTQTNKDLSAAEFSEMWQACLGADDWADEIEQPST